MISRFIYKITNVISNKCYIGKTTKPNPKRRFIEHLKEADSGSMCVIHMAMRKYGYDNFSFDIIDESAQNLTEHNELEKFYILKYDSYIHCDNPKWYNMTLGGDGLDSETARRFGRDRAADKNCFLYSIENSTRARDNAIKQVSEGRHPWQGPEASARTTKKHLENVINGTNPFAGNLGSELSRRISKDRIDNNTHNLAGEIGSKFQRGLIEQGVHHSQIVYTCPHCGKSGKGNRMKGSHFDKCEIRSIL